MTKVDKAFRNKKVLITGGLGFIGSTLAHRLVDLGSEILIVDSLLPDYGGNLFNIDEIKDKVKINIADVRDQSGMLYLVKGHDYMFNLAGTLSHIDSMLDPYTDLEINCRSQLSILEACRKNNPGLKIVFSGTRGQYGKAQYLPVDEKHPMCPTDVNGINNMAGEWYHILYNNVYGIRATSLRLTNTYGPRHQMRHSKQGFLNWFVRMAIEGREVPIFGDGAQKRDFNYVDDVADALLLAAATEDTNGEVYNIGSGEPVSVLETLKAIIDIAGKGKFKLVQFPEDKKKIEVGDYYADHSKFSKATGWTPSTSFKNGLEKTIKYYEKNKKYYW
jgi:UDP-glucose 4-epimerase